MEWRDAMVRTEPTHDTIDDEAAYAAGWTISGLATGPDKKDYRVPFIRRDAYAALSPRAKEFFAHWVDAA